MVCTEHYYEQIFFVFLLTFLRPWDNICCSCLGGGFHLREIVQVVQEHVVQEKNGRTLKIENKETDRLPWNKETFSFLPFLSSFPPCLLPCLSSSVSSLVTFSSLSLFLHFSSPVLSLSSCFLTPHSELESTFETVADSSRECFAIQEGDL